MPISDSMRIGLAASIGLHAVFLIGVSDPDAPGSGATDIRIDLNALEAVNVSETGALAIGSLDHGTGPDAEKMAERRRMLYRRYIEDVSSLIHAHRLDSGRKDLIGIALVVFHADAAGRFFDVSLKKSSGSDALDNAALRAVRAASGKVKRPKELGTHDITIFEEVRFQYGLR